MPDLADIFKAGAAAVKGAQSGDWGAAVAAVGKQAVGKITIRSQVSPDVVIDPFAPQAPAPAAPNPLLMFVKPEVVIQSPDGSTVTTLAPYGHPTGNYWPWLVAGAVVAVFGVFGLVAFVARRVR